MDVEQYIWMTSDFDVTYQNGQLYNPTTNCFGCAYHGNGGEKQKEIRRDIILANVCNVKSLLYSHTKI